MRLFKYKVSYRPEGMGAVQVLSGMVQVRPDVWSEEHISEMILKRLYNDDPRYYGVILEQIPIIG
jgi:hypothetical protein